MSSHPAQSGIRLTGISRMPPRAEAKATPQAMSRTKFGMTIAVRFCVHMTGEREKMFCRDVYAKVGKAFAESSRQSVRDELPIQCRLRGR